MKLKPPTAAAYWSWRPIGLPRTSISISPASSARRSGGLVDTLERVERVQQPDRHGARRAESGAVGRHVGQA